MHFTTVVQALTCALGAAAASVPSPVDLIRRQHTTGTVITKCAKPGVLALAFDDGPGQCKSTAGRRRLGIFFANPAGFVPTQTPPSSSTRWMPPVPRPPSS